MSKYNNWENIKKAAQCVFPRLNVNSFEKDENYKNSIVELVKIGCGGFCVFEGDSKAVRETVAELQLYSEIPLLFCADFENGLQMRLSDGTSFPHHFALGKTKIIRKKLQMQ